ncbi:uncharacterized protein LOC109726853 [Ananas comosus]|uniref:Uncharacterized protein LOC109726853 n=1 Tax=Ananas comosus TaxID=4615 RepID=A0A6P5H2I3_ANACO|nr:uncharacterized protein LOC109726853 [Ananas comosus]
MAHTSGRKSYKRKRKEPELILGNESHRLTFREATRKKKNKNFVNQGAEDNSNAARREFVELSQSHEFDSINCDYNRCAKDLGSRPTLRSYNRVKHLNLPTTNKASGGQSEEVKKLKVERQYVEDDMKKLEAELSKMREELNHLKELISDRVLNSQAVGRGNDLDDAFSSNNHSRNGNHHKSATKGRRRLTV